ncbi:hypothetical protein [Anatilimnocola floriformis]|uniref:hypothetical protein n=1 Tax=Anatilimnocola floriformis TaxID=2948575 RepID=UPI0020C41822|nr:hypothetical protein [Anatilimnocola floriformis]
MSPTNSKFELAERLCFHGEYSWRLKDGELRYRGTDYFKDLIVGRIPASNQQVEKFVVALQLLDVWNWRTDYNPNDIGHEVLDGGVWFFNIEIDGRSHKAAGVNAYPSYADPRKTSTDQERFRLLCAALYDCFYIDGAIQSAQRQAEIAKQIQTQPNLNSQ